MASVAVVAFGAGIAIGRHGSTKAAIPTMTTSTTIGAAPVLSIAGDPGTALLPLSLLPGGTVEVATRERRISCTPMGFASRRRAGVTYRQPNGATVSEWVYIYADGTATAAMNFARKQWGCAVATDAGHRKWSVAPVSYMRIAPDQAAYRIKAQDASGDVEDVIIMRVNDSALVVVNADLNDGAQSGRLAYTWARYKLGGGGARRSQWRSRVSTCTGSGCGHGRRAHGRRLLSTTA